MRGREVVAPSYYLGKRGTGLTGTRRREGGRHEERTVRPETREGTLDPTNLSTNRQRIAELARTKRGTALCSLHHVIDLDWMREAFRLTRKDGAPGIDGVTAAGL